MSTSGQIMFPFNVVSGVPIDSRLVVGPTHYYSNKESIVDTYPGLKTYVDNSGDPENGKTYMWDGSDWVLDTGGGITSGITSGITKGFVPVFESDDVIVRSAIRMGNIPVEKNVFIDDQGGTSSGFNDDELYGETYSLYVKGKIKSGLGFIGDGSGLSNIGISSTSGNLLIDRISRSTMGSYYLRSNGIANTWAPISGLPKPTLQQVTDTGSSTNKAIRFSNRIYIGPAGDMDYDIERNTTYGFSISRVGGDRIFGLEPATVDGGAQSIVFEGVSGQKVRFLTSHHSGQTNRRLSIPGGGIVNDATYHEVLSVNGRFVNSDNPNNLNGNIRLLVTRSKLLNNSNINNTKPILGNVTIVKNGHINYNVIEASAEDGNYPSNTTFGPLNRNITDSEAITNMNESRTVIVSNLTSVNTFKINGEFFINGSIATTQITMGSFKTYEFIQFDGDRWRLISVRDAPSSGS